MLNKDCLLSVNNYCKTFHTMKEKALKGRVIKASNLKLTCCFNNECFVVYTIKPNFNYNKWLVKE